MTLKQDKASFDGIVQLNVVNDVKSNKFETMGDCATRRKAREILGLATVIGEWGEQYATKDEIIEWGGDTKPLEKYKSGKELVNIEDVVKIVTNVPIRFRLYIAFTNTSITLPSITAKANVQLFANGEVAFYVDGLELIGNASSRSYDGSKEIEFNGNLLGQNCNCFINWIELYNGGRNYKFFINKVIVQALPNIGNPHVLTQQTYNGYNDSLYDRPINFSVPVQYVGVSYNLLLQCSELIY